MSLLEHVGIIMFLHRLQWKEVVIFKARRVFIFTDYDFSHVLNGRIIIISLAIKANDGLVIDPGVRWGSDVCIGDILFISKSEVFNMDSALFWI